MQTAESFPATKGEILIVDDTPASLAVLADILAAAGYAVRQAPDGELALWTVRKRVPDLILLDIRMPGIDGFEVCRRLKAEASTAEVPVIFLSASDAIEDRVQGLRLGAADYISKPYQTDEVLARVNNHVALGRLRRILEEERALLERRVVERTADLEKQRLDVARVVAAMDMAVDGIAIADADRKITYANNALIDTLGVAGLDGVIGRQIDDIGINGTPVVDPDELEAAREALASSNGRWRGEISIRRPCDSQTRTLLAFVRLLPDGGHVVVVNDVTEAHRLEAEQRRLEQQLDQARKLEALGKLTSGVVHDFNNLLGAILGFAEFIVEDTAGDNPLHRYATSIVRASQQAKGLIGQIHAFSHRHEATTELIDLGAMIAEHLNILKATVPPTTTLCYRKDVEGQMIAFQRSQIMQVLGNLVSNASEALNGRAGTVTIEVGTVDRNAANVERLFSLNGGTESNQAPVETWTDPDGTHCVASGPLLPETAYLRLSVSDTAGGVAPDVLPRIFDAFSTTKGKTGGTGLGLAVVHGIVVCHSGGLLVRSMPGHGSRFDILIPAVDAVESV